MAQAMPSQHPAVVAGGGSRVPNWVWDVIAAVVLILTGFFPNPDVPQPMGTTLAIMEIGLVAVAALLPLRRRYPTIVLGVCVLLAVLAQLSAISIIGFLAASATAMYRVAVETNRRRTVTLSVISMTALFASALSTNLAGWGYSHGIPSVAVIAAAAALGDSSRNRRALIDAITERAVRAEQTRELEADRRVTEERLRIARELHDAAAHQIASISLHAGVASNAIRARPDDAERALEVIRGSARSVISEISALLIVLRATPEAGSGLVAAPTVDLDALAGLIADFRTSGLDVSEHVIGDLSRVQGAVSFVAYRIVQEGLANALKHGADGKADLTVAVEADLLVIDVSNSADGAAPALPVGSGHHGLTGVRERVESVHGSATIGQDGPRFRLRAELPVRAADGEQI
jgi:signal transduction histidine kinase